MMTATIEEFAKRGGLQGIRDGQADDLFLVSAGYEPRTTAVTKALSADYRAGRAIIYTNREFFRNSQDDRTRNNVEDLRQRLQDRCGVLEVVEGSWIDPAEQAIKLRDSLTAQVMRNEVPRAITVDITTFTRESLLVGMAILRNSYPSARLRVVYVSPKDHGPWLSRGYREVRNIIGFPGIQRPSCPTVLVVLSGFEPERTVQLIEEHEPGKVLLGVGDPPTAGAFLERNLAEQKLVLARQDVEGFKFPATDTDAGRAALEKIIQPYMSDWNIVIAPMSTKLSTLAAFLIAERHSEIQLTYCVPGEYNVADYSAGAANIFVGEISHAD